MELIGERQQLEKYLLVPKMPDQSRGYVLKRMTLVDQFPHTAHIEAVALFEQVNDPYA